MMINVILACIQLPRNSNPGCRASKISGLEKTDEVMFHIKYVSYLLNFLISEPTQIYRYLRTRNMISPIFLHRTLSFMRKRTSRSRSDKYRQEFKVDSLLKRKESEIRETDTLKLDRYMNLTFLGYYDRKRKNIYLFIQ